MTLANLIIDLKNFLGPGYDVDDSGLTTWLNDAYGYMIDEIIKANPEYFVKSEDSGTVAGRQEYNLPSDYERMLMVNLSLSGAWRRATPFQSITNVSIMKDTQRAFINTNDPKYYLYGSKFGILPIPTTTPNPATSPNIKLWYVYSPAELSASSDTPAIPARYHHLLKLGAKANYLGRDDEDSPGAQLWARFESRVEQMVETMVENQLDEPKSIVITGDSSLYISNSEDNAF